MHRDELLDLLKGTLAKTKVNLLAAAVAKSTENIADLIELSFCKEKALAFRAAWILEHVTYVEPDKFMEYKETFIAKYPLQNNDSCRRHFTKIMLRLIGSRNRCVSEVNWLPVVEATFNWLADVKCAVAVKANCLEILFELRREEDWIEEELTAQTQFLMRDGTAAIQTRGRKVLDRLRGNCTIRN